MIIVRRLQKILALPLAVLLAALVVRAAGPALALRADVSVTGDSIYLSDLMPPDAPGAIHEIAAKILLGSAPKLGGTRILTGASIVAVLKASNFPDDVESPAEIVVHRAAREVTREEVAAAIGAALQRNGFPESAAITPEEIHLGARVAVSAIDPQLEVTRMDVDPALNQRRFLLISRAEPSLLPFLVTTPLGSASSSARGAQLTPVNYTVASGNSSDGLSVAQPRIPGLTGASGSRTAHLGGLVLVEPSKPAAMRVLSGNMRMLLTVVPLERGVLGENIRVRLPGTGRVLQGKVVGEGRLEAAF